MKEKFMLAALKEANKARLKEQKVMVVIFKKCGQERIF